MNDLDNNYSANQADVAKTSSQCANVNVTEEVWRNIWGIMLWAGAGGARLPIPSGESWFEQETRGGQQQQLQLTFTEFYLARDTLHFTAAGVSLIRSNTQTWIMQF